MRLPPLFRTTTPFRLTLLFLALFRRRRRRRLSGLHLRRDGGGGTTRIAGTASITRETQSLEGVYSIGGREALRRSMIERTQGDRPFLYLLQDPSGRRIWGTIPHGSVARFDDRNTDMVRFSVTSAGADGAVSKDLARGVRQKLTGGETLFVGQDVSEAEAYVFRIVRALWGAEGLVVVLGLVGGVIVSRNVNRSVSGLNAVVAAVRGGDLRARVELRGARGRSSRTSPRA